MQDGMIKRENGSRWREKLKEKMKLVKWSQNEARENSGKNDEKT